VVLSLPSKGPYFTFDPTQSDLPLITAVGSGPSFAYHKEKSPIRMTLLPEGEQACVCAEKPAPFGTGAAKGVFQYEPTQQRGEAGSGSVSFWNTCAPEPRGDLLVQKNPTCDVRTYTGGQIACHHMWSLLDAEQEIPWVDQPLTYHLKFRFWYQDYDPHFHTTLGYANMGMSIGAGRAGWGAEYDVPQCGDGVPGCSKGSDGTWVHTITGHMQTNLQSARPVVGHFHCHAPTCLSMQLFNNDTGELLCEEVSRFGQDRAETFDEPGYISVPPCMWGRPEDGLEAPPDFAGITLRVVKRANATYGHHGEMSHTEMYYVDTPATPP